MTALSARPVRISAVSAALEHRVLASRLNSCARKSSRRPTGSDDFEKLAGRLDMGPQPVDLLLDVGTRREDGGLLVEPLGIEGETGVDEAGHLLGQPAADQLSHPALPLPRLGHQACDLRQLTLEHAFELGALGPLHGAQAPNISSALAITAALRAAISPSSRSGSPSSMTPGSPSTPSIVGAGEPSVVARSRPTRRSSASTA